VCQSLSQTGVNALMASERRRPPYAGDRCETSVKVTTLAKTYLDISIPGFPCRH
jgi:hypothetical protein